jgi:hypothetical protein
MDRYPEGRDPFIRLGSFLQLNEEEQLAQAQRLKDRSPELAHMSVEDILAVLVARAEEEDESVIEEE